VVARLLAFPVCCCIFFFVLFAVRERVRRTAKVPLFVVRPIPGARQSPLDVISPGVDGENPST
jgi:hypothetical protein